MEAEVSGAVLASGVVRSSSRPWHAMKIAFRGDTIRGSIDGQLLARVRDASRGRRHGLSGQSYHGNLFERSGDQQLRDRIAGVRKRTELACSRRARR